MSGPAYPAARSVASRVHAHFLRHIRRARDRGKDDLAPEPDAAAVEAIIDAAFWASLRREEGVTPTISLAYLPPSQAGQPLKFETPLPLQPAALAKLAPAVERPGIHLGVWRDENVMRVWGTTRSLPVYCFAIEVIDSGLLVIKHRSESFGKFVNVAVLEGDQVKIVDEGEARAPDCPGLLRSLLGIDAPGPDGTSVNVLVQLAASMRAHGRGGALAVVPAGTETWRQSVVGPVLYALDPPYTGLSSLMLRDTAERASHEWQEDLRRAVDAVAGLTAVDGATVVSDQYDVLAFGTKLTRKRGSTTVDRVVVSEPIEGSTTSVAMPTQLGGTRHLSAAQFVHDQHDAIVLVASQDGRFTIFKWAEHDSAVHAHRVEALLL